MWDCFYCFVDELCGSCLAKGCLRKRLLQCLEWLLETFFFYVEWVGQTITARNMVSFLAMCVRELLIIWLKVAFLNTIVCVFLPSWIAERCWIRLLAGSRSRLLSRGLVGVRFFLMDPAAHRHWR